MIRLELNKVYQHEHDKASGRMLRLLCTHDQGAHFIDVDAPSEPAFFASADDLALYRLSEHPDPWLKLRTLPEEDLTAHQIASRNLAYAPVKRVCEMAQADAENVGQPWIQLLMERHHRVQIIAQVAQETGKATNSITRWLWRWFKRGMCSNSCLPDTEKMAGKGTVRAIPKSACDSSGNPIDPSRWGKPGRKKMGRNFRPAFVGTRMTEPLLESIRSQGVKLYLENKNYTFDDAYCMWKEVYKMVHSVDRLPSYGSFLRILRQNDDVADAAKQRRHFGRKQRQKPPVRESTSTRVPGPGFRYQIDSTPPPVRLKYSHADKGDHAATVYFVSDTASKSVTGYYISTKPACAQSAFKAYHQSTEDKVAYCQRHGITITRGEWPMATVPHELVADRGELVGPVANVLVSHYMINLKNTPAYSPQLKSDVEAAFGAAMRRLIDKLSTTRPVRRPGKNGPPPVLTIDEFHTVIIRFILDYNSRMLDRIPSPDEARRGVIMTPTGYWNSEHDRLRGEGRTFDPGELRLTLSNRGKARINRQGINFESLLYDCDLPEAADLLEKMGDRSKQVTIYYDDENTSLVYIQVRELMRAGLKTEASPYTFVACKLHANDSKWAGYTFSALQQAMEAHNEKMQAALVAKDTSSARLLEAIKSPGLAVPVEAAPAGATPAQDDNQNTPPSDDIVQPPAPANNHDLIRPNILGALRSTRR